MRKGRKGENASKILVQGHGCMDRKTFDLNQGGKCQFVSLEFWGVSQGVEQNGAWYDIIRFVGIL